MQTYEIHIGCTSSNTVCNLRELEIRMHGKIHSGYRVGMVTREFERV